MHRTSVAQPDYHDTARHPSIPLRSRLDHSRVQLGEGAAKEAVSSWTVAAAAATAAAAAAVAVAIVPVLAASRPRLSPPLRSFHPPCAPSVPSHKQPPFSLSLLKMLLLRLYSVVAPSTNWFRQLRSMSGCTYVQALNLGLIMLQVLSHLLLEREVLKVEENARVLEDVVPDIVHFSVNVINQIAPFWDLVKSLAIRASFTLDLFL